MTDPRRLRILVADDSATARRRIINALGADSSLEVIGEVAHGSEVVARCAALRPDVLVLDVAMPGIDGVRATETIMTTAPTPILIVSSSSRDSPGVRGAIEAGAVDSLDKPRLDEPDHLFDSRLVRTVRLVAKIPLVTRKRGAAPVVVEPVEPVTYSDSRRELVVIGGSTGGPAAVLEMLKVIPPRFPIPILLVLHLGPAFGLGFSEWLSGMSRLPVVDAEHGRAPLPGRVHVAPHDRHLVFRDGKTWFTNDPERHSCRPSVDVLFESVAENAAPNAIGCLLTGIGRDGAEGLRKMRERGALTLVQDEASSAVFGMPREAILRGAAMHVGAPADLAKRIVAAARVGRGSSSEAT